MSGGYRMEEWEERESKEGKGRQVKGGKEI